MSVVQYLNPWRLKRQRAAARVAALRARDGDNCARCRRAMRFDLPPGHEGGVVIEPTVPGAKGAALEDLRLCHPRCNPSGVDHTDEVLDRRRRKNETEIFARARKSRKRKAA